MPRENGRVAIMIAERSPSPSILRVLVQSRDFGLVSSNRALECMLAPAQFDVELEIPRGQHGGWKRGI
jgi:hypothetical protein